MSDTVYICAAAYLLGSIPFGLLLTRLWGIDLRQVGSGNIGATNVLRTGKKALALTTLLLDALKGTLAVLLAVYNVPDAPDIAGLAALLALLGHCFPVWLRFRGGKGVATLLGAWLALSPPVFCGIVLAWLAGAFATRMSSCGALAMCSVLPLLAYWLAPHFLIVSLIMALLVIAKHHANLRRIVAGTEPKIGKSA